MAAATDTTQKASDRLIFTDLAENNNKFWHADLVDQVLTVNWGRVGDRGQTKAYTFTSYDEGLRDFNRQVNAKLRKGYTRQQTIVDGAKPDVKFVAKVQIQHNNDAQTVALIDFLIQRNIHKIEGLTSIRMESGRLTTPLGPVTLVGLDEAEKLLVGLAAKGDEYYDFANQYLRIIPRNIGHGRIHPDSLFGSSAQLEAEQAMIDSLRAVVRDMDQKVAKDVAAAPPVFATKLEIIDGSAKDWDRIRKYYERSINKAHATAGLKLRQIWRMEIEHANREFQEKIGNVRELWHGTKDANLLSILKNGYVIAGRGSGIAINGRMFGNGVYFSDQSTKSLNYTSAYWGGSGSKRSFMLLNDVAMGTEYIPGGKGGNGVGRLLPRFHDKPPKGYDSCFAKSGVSGVMNNEMIVYNTNQIRPTYLCEFS